MVDEAENRKWRNIYSELRHADDVTSTLNEVRLFHRKGEREMKSKRGLVGGWKSLFFLFLHFITWGNFRVIA